MSEIRITLNEEQIAEAISLTFTSKYKEEMTQCLMAVLEDNEKALASLYKVAIGVRSTVEYTEGTEISVETTPLSTWRMAIAEMNEVNMITDNLLTCTIIGVNKYSETPYKVMYEYLDADDITSKLTTFSYINPVWIKGEAKKIITFAKSIRE